MINYSNKISKNYENDRPYKMKNNHPLKGRRNRKPTFFTGTVNLVKSNYQFKPGGKMPDGLIQLILMILMWARCLLISIIFTMGNSFQLKLKQGHTHSQP